MKKVLFRILAYVLDIAIVTLITLGLSMTTLFNPNNDELNNMYKDYNTSIEKYDALKESLDKYMEDYIIYSEDYDEILEYYPEYIYIFDDVTIGEQMSEEEANNMYESIDKRYRELLSAYNKEINKLNIYEVILSVIVYILYFGVLQYFMKGQTPFKRLFRIKVVNKNNSKKEIPLWSFILRSILVCEVLFILVDLALAFIMKADVYYTTTYWINESKYIYELIFLVLIILRDDNRSIDDLLLGTRVLRYDKSGKEIEETLFKLPESDEDDK